MIYKHDIRKFLVSLSIVMLFFSSTCLWSETNLSIYLKVSIIIVGLTVLLGITKHFSVHKILNHRYILWVLINYSIFELYGLLFLRIGEFNWDFVLFSGILQICLIFAFMSLDNVDEVIDTFCRGCKWALLFVCLFMISQGSIDLKNITFGSRLGDELSGNVNTVATNIGLMLLPTVLLTLINDRKKKNDRIITWLIIILSTLCMVLTGSKKGILVLLIIIMFYFLALKTPIKYIILPISIIMGTYALFNVSFLYNTIGFRIIDMFATFGIGTSVTRAQSTAIRNNLIHEGLHSFWNHPILGGGMNYFQYINHTSYYAHNNYIELLNDVGIVGTLIYYLPFLFILIKLVKKIKNKRLISQRRTLYLFLISYLCVKFVLDYTMVSFSAMCTFLRYVAEIKRRISIVKNKILLIHRSLGLGGAEKIFAFVANSLSKKYEVKVLLLSKTDKTVYLNKNISIVEKECYSNSPIIGRNMLKEIAALKKMSRIILDEVNIFSADLVICFDLRIILSISFVMKKMGAKVIFSERADPYENPKYWTFILKNIYKRIDFIIFQTENARNFYTDIVHGKNTVIPNPAFARMGLSKTINIKERKPYIFAAGRFQRRKGFDILINAFGKICRKFPQYSLVLYGEGEDENLIKNLIIKLKIQDKVVIKKPENGVVEKNRDASLFVIPSRSEGIPNILIEAMMEKIPCIATDCSPGGARMLSGDGKYCLLADNDDIDSLAEMISYALENKNEMDNMSELAKKSLNRFEPAEISRLWLVAVNRVLESL